jgi:hypothetical protein
MLAALRLGLDLNDPFEAAVWAICACAFWEIMQFGEVTIKRRTSYKPSIHISRGHVLFSHDQLGHL